MRAELASVLALACTLAPGELPRLLGELEEIRATALARISAPAVVACEDRNLNVEEAAARMHVSRDYLYRHHKRFPFARRIGRKLLFNSSGLDSYLKQSH